MAPSIQTQPGSWLLPLTSPSCWSSPTMTDLDDITQVTTHVITHVITHIITHIFLFILSVQRQDCLG